MRFINDFLFAALNSWWGTKNAKNTTMIDFLAGVLKIKIQLGRSLTLRREVRRPSTICWGREKVFCNLRRNPSLGTQTFLSYFDVLGSPPRIKGCKEEILNKTHSSLLVPQLKAEADFRYTNIFYDFSSIIFSSLRRNPILGTQLFWWFPFFFV